MAMIYIQTFISVILVSLISLVGIFALSLKENVLRKYIFIFISIAVGALLGDAFIHLIPEAFENARGTATTSVLVIVGIILFFTMEKLLHWHHHGQDKENTNIHPMGKLILFSDSMHNFLDGIIIGASFTVSATVGVATTLAVILHEIPQEIGDFAVLLHSGYQKRRALWLNFLSALASIIGAVVFFAFGDFAETLSLNFIPIAAGGFIYIAMSDLIPELHKSKEAKISSLQLVSISIGVLAMIALAFLE